MAVGLLSPSLTPLTLPFKRPKPTYPLLLLPLSPLSRTRAATARPWPRPLSSTALPPSSELADVEETPETLLRTTSHEETEALYGQNLEEVVLLLKRAAKTRKVPPADVLSAMSIIKKAKVDASSFLRTLGGSESPGRTWMLIFTAQGALDKGRYFPVTAVQRFDAEAGRIENGVYLGPIGSLTFEGKFSWKKKKILAFMFECLRIRLGPLGPFEVGLGKQEREPTTKEDPFFIWLYIDDEIAVAQGRGGGIALWCRCHRAA